MIWLAAALASPLVNPDVPVQLLDIDSDGFVDVVLGGGESAHFGDGTGAFGPHRAVPSTSRDGPYP